MRIRTAIFVVYVVASALGLSVMTALVLRDVRLRYVESMRRTMGDIAAYMAAFASPESAEGDWTGKLTALPQQDGMLRVFACDRTGKVLFDSANRDVGQVYRWNMLGGGRLASENYTQSNVALVNGELRVVARVMAGEEHVGWVGLGRPLTAIEDGVRAARWRLVIAIGSIAGVMVLLGWWLAVRLTRSLEKLAEYARKVRDGLVAVAPSSRAREIAELARAFEEMRDALEGRQHVERYTQALAHEVKSPLAAIRGAAELMDETMPAEKRAKFLANIRQEAARIQRIIERLLELSSLEARKQLQQTTHIDAMQLAVEAIDIVRPAAAARDITIELDMPRAISIRGDVVLLREALVNLLQNAVEFSPKGGVVKFAVRLAEAQMEFTVEDNGPGVPDYALSRVFERFYSLPRPDTDKKSTGLGLALVREIAHLHGGTATLANRPEGGARSSLTLPKVLIS